jgi:hypothetical protein
VIRLVGQEKRRLYQSCCDLAFLSSMRRTDAVGENAPIEIIEFD